MLDNGITELDRYTPACRVCRSISGESPVGPGPVIHDGNYWRLEHAYPSQLKGWLVIVLKRHAQALHEIHIIPKTRDLPENLWGTKVFQAININASEALPRDEVRALCEKLTRGFDVTKT